MKKLPDKFGMEDNKTTHLESSKKFHVTKKRGGGDYSKLKETDQA